MSPTTPRTTLTSGAWSPSSCSARPTPACRTAARGDGLTFLDVLWQHAPFATSAVFLAAVRALADAWLADGLFSRAERDRVVAAATAANLRR